jgi:hypothetical protein
VANRHSPCVQTIAWLLLLFPPIFYWQVFLPCWEVSAPNPPLRSWLATSDAVGVLTPNPPHCAHCAVL